MAAGQAPAAEYPLGTDSQGRDLMAVMIAGTPLTLYMGLLAGFLLLLTWPLAVWEEARERK